MRRLFFLILFSLPLLKVTAQSVQDCDGAVQVCSLNYVQNMVTPGYGAVQELLTPLIASNNSCLAAGEQNSTWYRINVNASGNLEFTITPNTLTDDYDWALYDITNTGCSGIKDGVAPQLVCNYSVFPGNTGLSPAGAGSSADPLEPNFCLPVSVQAGGVYALVVNNSSLSSSGYEINFSGSAGLLDNNIPMPLSIAHRDCDQVDTLELLLSDYVACSSVAPDGSDFTLVGSGIYYGYVLAAQPAFCNAAGYTNAVKIILSQRIQYNDFFVVTVNNGTDGNTLVDLCGNATPSGTSIDFNVNNIPVVELGPDTSICKGETLTLSAGNEGLNHTWSTGATTPSIDITVVPTTAYVMVDRNGCYATDSIRVDAACTVFVPNAFSPNNDGKNDVFWFISTHVNKAELTVYNRWGSEVFYSDTEEQPWDGTDGWDADYPAGMYVYVIRGTFRGGESFEQNGTVLLIR